MVFVILKSDPSQAVTHVGPQMANQVEQRPSGVDDFDPVPRIGRMRNKLSGTRRSEAMLLHLYATVVISQNQHLQLSYKLKSRLGLRDESI